MTSSDRLCPILSDTPSLSLCFAQEHDGTVEDYRIAQKNRYREGVLAGVKRRCGLIPLYRVRRPCTRIHHSGSPPTISRKRLPWNACTTWLLVLLPIGRFTRATPSNVRRPPPRPAPTDAVSLEDAISVSRVQSLRAAK